MEYLKLLTLLLVPLVRSECPTGYEDIGNGNCYKTFTTPHTTLEAEAHCEQEGGHLVQPLNAFVNTLIQNEAATFNTLIWLGLTCSGSSYTSCVYANGDAVTSSSYTNFYPGSPDPDRGNCVFLSSSGSLTGKWISGNCLSQSFGYGCQVLAALPPNYVPTCGSSFKHLDDYCYKIIPSMSEENAKTMCETECGHLTSIHTKKENEFILDLFQHTDEQYARIGLEWKGTRDYEWTDRTVTPATDYDNFGFADPSLGNCVAMSLVDDIVPSGKWINTFCSTNMTSVCKRPMTKPCASFVLSNSTTVSPAAVATLAPPTCSSTMFFEGNGTLYSAGYPSNYASQLECEYVITAPPGFVVFFALNGDDHFPDDAGSISLYNSITDTVPFIPRLIYGYTYDYTFYASTTSSMKVKFSSGSSDKYKWTANYTSVDIRPSGCNQGVLQTPGTITSPNYGSNLYGGHYPSQYNCSYQLEAPSNKRISLIFNYFYTEPSDAVSVYDGPDSKSTLLGKYSYSNVPPPITSSNNRMFLIFTSDYYASYTGFKATFTTVSQFPL